MPLIPTLSQMNPVYILPYYFFTIHSNIILLSTKSYSRYSFPFTLFYGKFVWTSSLISLMRATRLVNLVLFDVLVQMFGEK